MTTTKLLAVAFAVLTTAGLTFALDDPPERDRERGPRDGERERGPRDGDRDRGPRDGDRERGPRDGAPRDGERGGPPPRGDRPVFPLIKALDRNSDGVIDSSEIEGAVAALKSLDRNSDGKLTREELMPNFAGMRRDGQRPPGEGDRRPRPDGEGDRGPRPGGEGAQRRGNPAEMFARMDKNGDGSLSKDEAPEQMRDKFDMIDGNDDGSVTKQELISAFERRMKQAGQGGNRGGDRDATEGGEKPRRPPQKDKDREKN